MKKSHAKASVEVMIEEDTEFISQYLKVHRLVSGSECSISY